MLIWVLIWWLAFTYDKHQHIERMRLKERRQKERSEAKFQTKH